MPTERDELTSVDKLVEAIERELARAALLRGKLSETELAIRVLLDKFKGGDDEKGQPVPDGNDEHRVVLVFDGGTSCNGSRVSDSYGSFKINDAAPVRVTFPKGLTNNEAEYGSLIAGLEAVAKMFPPESTVVEVHGDSALVINQVNGDWNVKQEHLRPLCWKAQELADQFKDITFEWWPRKKSVELLGH
jgi:ribonuclease HI